MDCAYCGAPIHFVRKAGGWLHSQPLAELRVDRWERQDVLSDPPRAGEELHRRTVLHRPGAASRTRRSLLGGQFDNV